MKFQRSTLILMGLALGLTGAVYVFEIQGKTQQQEIQAKQQQIFSFPKNEIQSFTITTPQQTVTLERVTNADELKKSPWKITAPIQFLANPASVDYLLRELFKNQSNPSDINSGIQKLTVSTEKLKDYGLDTVTDKIEIKLKNNTIYKLSLGKNDFRGDSLYAQIDSPQTSTKEVNILVISNDILSTINRPLEEWKLPSEIPPTPPTPQPTPTPSASPK
ncbi:DUF4340 domain-containing protein [Planktothrix agardhii]|uniref:DUF4340 domain-containing protein n=1 Tax=Planktothrix agardhii TaxID=1160 RepID=UPI001B99C077|nr:DUF4340 domain-containing protein [Planktothrix agardhii]CAD0229656.1 conserved hypothetical protein [Planktothrix agardhii]CAD5981879.1 hypothetical protein NO758_04798 [Planktothrix agardhii]